ncbi:MAG TPA: hypothetical protein VMG12_05710 [Polyangiaceae bacterium]|nr:hypothetical protein [Polyangiaceae bacterium]
MATLLMGHTAQARDLPRTDPDRKLILDGARGQHDVKLIVKDLYKDGDFALLCALRQEPNGSIIGTDDMLDVYEWVLIRDAGRWIARGTGGGFAQSVSSASCARAPKSQADIIDALAQAIRGELLGVMIARRPIDHDYAALFELLERKGHTTGVPMDEDNELPQFRVSLLLEACKKNPRCEAETRRVLTRVEALRKSEHVNALAWNFCDQAASRTNDAAVFQRCLDTAAAEPACRTGQRLPRDRPVLERCAATLSSSAP